MTTLPLTPLVSRIVASTAILFMVAGSVLIFFTPSHQFKEKPKKLEIAQSEFKFDSIPPREPIPKRVAPSKSTRAPAPKKTSVPTKSASAAGTGRPSNSPTHPVATPQSTPPPKPSPRPSSRPSSTPTLTTTPTPPPSPSGTTWYTSQTAIAAAQRMYGSGVVGDPVCSVASHGEPDPSLVPSDVKSVGVGSYQDYWCLIFTR